LTIQRDLIQKRLREEGDKLIAAFETLTPAQWSSPIYSDGMEWTLKDLLAHLISAEHEFQYYGRQIAAGGPGAPEGFDINGFNNQAVAAMREHDADQLLSDLRAARRQTIDLVAEFKDEDFARSGRHPVFEQMTIEEMFKLIYRHNMMHMRDVRRALGEA
jgi:uncharacterized protein (TIGR03083 family)